MIDEDSLTVFEIEIQKGIVRLLYENSDITANQHNLILSKLNKKIQSLKSKKKKESSNLNPVFFDIEV